MKHDAIPGCIIGTAVGDALGLPYEGMSPRRAARVFRDLGRHHFFFGRGMVSDDTEHTCLVAQAILASRNDPDAFEARLSWGLRWWLLGLPAGVGLATLRSIIKLWLGFSAENSGVFSAGNGPAMRSALLGVIYGNQPELLREFVRRATRQTHSDPKAYIGALATAVAAHLSASGRKTLPGEYVKVLRGYLVNEAVDEFMDLIGEATISASRTESLTRFANSIGCAQGISGYVYHTVPCVIQTWLRHQEDFRFGMEEILRAGGDTDTTGATLGGIIGARVGMKGIPPEWVRGIIEWPRSVRWMKALSDKLGRSVEDNTVSGTHGLFVPGIPVRNAFFTFVVLVHALRRLAPPY